MCTPIRSRIGASGAPLQLQGTLHCVSRTGERGHEAVALPLLHRPHPAMGGDDFGDGLGEARDRGGHLLGLGLPQPRGALDVCQKQRHRSRRQKPAHAQLALVQWRFRVGTHASRAPGDYEPKTSAEACTPAGLSCGFTPSQRTRGLVLPGFVGSKLRLESCDPGRKPPV